MTIKVYWKDIETTPTNQAGVSDGKQIEKTGVIISTHF